MRVRDDSNDLLRGRGDVDFSLMTKRYIRAGWAERDSSNLEIIRRSFDAQPRPLIK